MNPVKAIIVDDEQHAIDSFTAIAADACPFLEIIAAYTHPEALLQHLESRHCPDMLFLDIEMSPYSGFKLLELVQEKYRGVLPFDVLFLTAYDQYAIKAFSYNALDYLLKPLMPADLQQAVRKWQQKSFKQLHPVQWQQLQHYMDQRGVAPDRMAVPNLEGYEILFFKDIIRCEADRNYTHIIDKDLQRHIVCRTLKEVESIVCEHGFLRVHHSHIINPLYVIKILKEAGGTLEMTDNERITITRDRDEMLARLFAQIKKL